jgi:alkanesulfonate monooxygenase SsuD/methylene tetrahydromethanopterin reductase-like flavin-dependent oxidoreductase (luciferase family)
MAFGRLGVWYSTDKLNGGQLADLVRAVEGNGYSAFWYPESRGYESMSLAAYLLSKSDRLTIGSSIANIYARDSFTARRATISLNDWHGGRFILGVGVSHIPMVEGVRGHRYDKPIPAMRAYLEGLARDGGNDLPVVVAALGPKMLALSAEMSRFPTTSRPSTPRGQRRSSARTASWRSSRRSRSRPTRSRPANSGARNWRATWCCRTTATTGCASASARAIWPTVAATASSTRCACGATPRR